MTQGLASTTPTPAAGEELQARLRQGFAVAGMPVDQGQLTQLAQLLTLLRQWSRRVNLTGLRTDADLVTKHVLDSAAVMPWVTGREIADLGTGAGFPGLVLAILAPGRRFTLIDSVAKKTAFVRAAVASLGLAGVEVVTARMESLPPTRRFDTVVSRAVASLDRLAALGMPYLRPGGRLVAMKGKLEPEEVQAVARSVRIKQISPVSVPGLPAVRQVVIMSALRERAG